MRKQTRLVNFLMLGVIITLICALPSCKSEICGWPDSYMFQVTNKTDSVIYFNHYLTDKVNIHTRCIMRKGESATEIYSGDIIPPYPTNGFMTLEFRDSVIEIRPMMTDADGNSRNVFSFKNIGDEDNYEYYYEFTDEYITEIADTMRKLGIEPYRISKEVVKNSSSQDFSLDIVTPDKTYKCEVNTGEAKEIEMMWLMESEDTCGTHRYDFHFRDSTLTVYPVMKVSGGVQSKRFFTAETTREDGGLRVYEITDGLFATMSKEMRILRAAKPEMFK